jgi:hypothetical protein
LAEGAGFEPAIRFPAYTLSRRAPSTARPPLPHRVLVASRAHNTRRRRGASRLFLFAWTASALLRSLRTSLQGNEVLRLLVRALGVLLLAGAFAAAVVDSARSLADQHLTMTPMGLALATIFPTKFELWSKIIQTRLPHFVWDPLLLWILYAPAFLDLAVLGLAVTSLSRPTPQPEARSILNH